MSNLIEYIKQQRGAGLTDYQILQKAKNMRGLKGKTLNQVGGFTYAPDDNGFVLEYDDNGDLTGRYYDPIANNFLMSTGEGADDIAEFVPNADEFIGYGNRGTTDQTADVITDNNVANDPSGDDPTITDITLNPVITASNPAAETLYVKADTPEGEIDLPVATTADLQGAPNLETDPSTYQAYTTIPAGTILYHPTSEVRRLNNNNNMIFVKLTDILDSRKQRSFTMFFTPNREYARRFAGIQSLNKRDVYVHKLRTKGDITNIRRIEGDLIAKDTDNIDLGAGFCGPSPDGVVNGIEITHNTRNGLNGNSLKEYYICNPEQFFSLEASEMLFDATTWVDVTNGEHIYVPEEAVDLDIGEQDIGIESEIAQYEY